MEERHTTTPSSGGGGKKSRAKWIAAGTAVVLLGSYLALCAWVGATDRIMGHVTMAGVPVGNLTREEAQREIQNAIDQLTSPVSLSLKYGHWTGELPSAAMDLDVGRIAQKAWDVGRDHFLLQGGVFLGHCMGMGTDMDLILSWNPEGERQAQVLMDEADQLVGGALTNASYAMEGDKLMLTKGVTGTTINREEAKALILEGMTQALTQAVTGEGTHTRGVTLPAHESGPQEPDFDAMYQELHVEAKNSEVDPKTHQATDHVVGIDFDVQAAKQMYQSAGEGETVAIPVTITQPKETKESLQSKLFRDVLGQASSRVRGTANRTKNVKLSAKACNGVVLMPGDVFSYNNTTGSRSASKGYLPAPAYVGGASVDQLGGGICQTSSTIYYALLHTTLDVVERQPHRYAVGYVPDGMDATVYYGSIDFRFKNTTNYPIKLVTDVYTSEGKTMLSVKIYGTNEDGRYAEPSSSPYNYVTPTTQYVADPSIPRGETQVDQKQNPYTGRSAQTYRYVYDRNGNLVDKQNMGTSIYKMRPKTILYNPADGDPSTWVNGVPPTTTPPVTPEKPPEPQNSQPLKPVGPQIPEIPKIPTIPEIPTSSSSGGGETAPAASQAGGAA